MGVLRAAAAAVLAASLLALLAAPRPADAQPTRPCTVRRVIDGDTFVCRDDERVRVLLVNTPEMGDEPLGRLAREFVVGVMPPGTEVRLEMDVQERDRYGRLLAYVRLPDGRWLNRVVARAGYAQVMVIPPNVDRVEEMRAAVWRARREGAGLWGREGFGEEEPPGAGAADREGVGGGEPGRATEPRRGGAGEGCADAYPGLCIAPPPPDLDCGEVRASGFRVEGADPHRFDGDDDGVGCEGE